MKEDKNYSHLYRWRKKAVLESPWVCKSNVSCHEECILQNQNWNRQEEQVEARPEALIFPQELSLLTELLVTVEH